MMGMMGKVKEMQARMKEVKDNLVHLSAEGESGAGVVKVKVKVNGLKQVITIDIDSSLINTNDKTTLQDLIVAATNKALVTIDELAKEEFRKKTEGLIPNIPGMDLGSMFGM